MRVLVCGGRDFWDRAAVHNALDNLDEVSAIIEGGAGGADALARDWAQYDDVPVETFVANWKMQGRAAGPMRNSRMIHEGKPDLVLAFPGGRGTADMVRKAKVAGLHVVEVKP